MAAIRFKGMLVLLAVIGSITLSQGQTITSGKDSTLVPTATDTTSEGIADGLKKWDKPSRAALYSAIIPGAGQVYNKSFWKVPIIYAGGATIGYFIVKWHKNYLLYRSSYDVMNDGDSTTIDRFVEKIPDAANRARVLANGRDTYRRWRDLNIIFAVFYYGLNVSEAYVDAHLKGFDISDELSMRIEPTLLPGPAFMSYAPGISVRFNFKK